VTTEIGRRYLGELKKQDIDTLILGCTHYPLLKETIQELMGEKICLINPAYETAKELKQLLTTNKITAPHNSLKREHEFYVSDTADKFQSFAGKILGVSIQETRKINIEEY
jgi:glutamate racemase